MGGGKQYPQVIHPLLANKVVDLRRRLVGFKVIKVKAYPLSGFYHFQEVGVKVEVILRGGRGRSGLVGQSKLVTSGLGRDKQMTSGVLALDG